jgi:hypothetical protein
VSHHRRQIFDYPAVHLVESSTKTLCSRIISATWRIPKVETTNQRKLISMAPPWIEQRFDDGQTMATIK